MRVVTKGIDRESARAQIQIEGHRDLGERSSNSPRLLGRSFRLICRPMDAGGSGPRSFVSHFVEFDPAHNLVNVIRDGGSNEWTDLHGRSVPAPGRRRSARNASNPSCHVSLIGKVRVHRDSA